ncbi:hypothetical protein [Gimesia chilikensis]|nr:hypothetical protein [Gimesia chilikensis]
MAKSLTQRMALALFFSPLLFLLPFHALKAADDTPLSSTSLQLSVVDEGNRTLTVHSRDGGSSCDVVIPHSFSE